jgi:hypothetical protein
LLDLGVEVLNAQADAVEAVFSEHLELGAGRDAWVHLDAPLRVFVGREARVEDLAHARELLRREEGGRSSPDGELDAPALPPDGLGQHVGLALQVVQVGLGDAVVSRDLSVAGAVVAEAFAEGDVYVQGEGAPSTQCERPSVIVLAELLAPDRCRGVARVAWAGAVVPGKPRPDLLHVGDSEGGGCTHRFPPPDS